MDSLYWQIEAAMETVEAMFADIDWCKGHWCPIPRPTVSEEDRATLRGYGLTVCTEEDLWIGTPQFEGVLPVRGVSVKLGCTLRPVEGDMQYVWRLTLSGGALLEKLPKPLVVEQSDPVVAVVEAMLVDDSMDYGYEPPKPERLELGVLNDSMPHAFR